MLGEGSDVKTIINKTNQPLKIPLARGRLLRLGPFKEGQIATNEASRESLQKLTASGAVEIFDDIARSGSLGRANPSGRAGGQRYHQARIPTGRNGDR